MITGLYELLFSKVSMNMQWELQIVPNLISEEVKIMREGIHPEYHQATVTCNCGNTFVTGSTKKDIHVEICSKCHSFYTGQQKTAAARGRIDKFNRKYGITNK